MDDNFWSMGIAGPCGPCSELYYDRGPDYGVEGGPAVDEDRYMEFWNLVFMQNQRGPQDGPGKSDYPILGELPKKNIDTGMGMERMATLLQGVDNLYEIDQTRPVLDRAAEEEAFLQTLKAGTTILDVAVAETKQGGGTQLSGDKAFQLHDTYGFPIDLTLEMAAEQGVQVDEAGFRRLMAEQRARAKADA